ncbi:MAG: Minf_1886 family protein [Planctomycetota bacterium]
MSCAVVTHRISQILEWDRRFPHPAYEFALDALDEAVAVARSADPNHGHISGEDLLHTVKLVAFERFGPLASFVLRQWGIPESRLFWDVYRNLFSVGLVRFSEGDMSASFEGGFDVNTGFDDLQGKMMAELGSIK